VICCPLASVIWDSLFDTVYGYVGEVGLQVASLMIIFFSVIVLTMIGSRIISRVIFRGYPLDK